ncbi:hypothetical protein M9458_001753, partial [Cirrhinus mrigala]
TKSSLYPDQMVTAVIRIQSVSSPHGGPAPRDDLYNSGCQLRPGQLDGPQRQILSKDLIISSSPDPLHNPLHNLTFL